MDFNNRVREKNAIPCDDILQKLLSISHEEHIGNEDVRRKIQAAIGEYDKLLFLGKETETELVLIHLKVFCSANYAWSKEIKKIRRGREKKKKRIIRSGQGWTVQAQPGQLKTNLDGKGLLQSSVVPNASQSYGII